MFDYDVKAFPIKNPKGSLVGNASVLIGGLVEVKNFKVFKAKDGKLFVKNPSHSYEKDGETKYTDNVWFHEEKAEGEFMGPRQAEIFSAILQAYGEASQESPGENRSTAAKNQTVESTKPATDSSHQKVPKKKLWPTNA